MKRLEKLVGIRKRQRSIAVAGLSASQHHERTLEVEVVRIGEAVDALIGQSLPMLQLEALGWSLDAAERALDLARAETSRRRALADAAAAAESRAETLKERADQATERARLQHEQKTQDDRRRGSAW